MSSNGVGGGLNVTPEPVDVDNVIMKLIVPKRTFSSVVQCGNWSSN